MARSKRRISGLQLKNSEIVPSLGSKGGLWLLWSDDIRVRILEKSFYFVFALIEDDSNQWVLGMIYGDPHRGVNGYIWERIVHHATSNNLPLCIIGDFNAILHHSEKQGGSYSMNQASRGFRRMVNDAGLIDLGYKGPAYTWSNCRGGGDLILERLDRVLATIEWTGMFPKAEVLHLPRLNSDHNPILLRMEPKPIRRKPNFKVENWWLLCGDFGEVCSSALQGGGSDWKQVLGKVKGEISKWAAAKPRPDVELKKIEAEMAVLQQNPASDPGRTEEFALLGNYNVCLAKVEAYWLQRSRLKWTSEGDRNTKFFHSVTATRRRKNSITMIKQNDGTWTVDGKKVRKAFVSFFQGLILFAG